MHPPLEQVSTKSRVGEKCFKMVSDARLMPCNIGFGKRMRARCVKHAKSGYVRLCFEAALIQQGKRPYCDRARRYQQRRSTQLIITFKFWADNYPQEAEIFEVRNILQKLR